MAVLDTYQGHYLWKYIPSMPAAIVFVVLFIICTVAHGWKLLKTRMWFCIPFLIGGIFEIIGYIGRVLAHNSTGSLPPYIMQSLLLLLAPILFAASIYMTFSRVVRAVQGEKICVIPFRFITPIFVSGDVGSFMIQGGGGGILAQAKTQSKINLGNNIIVGGLVFQVVMFAVFIIVCVHFNLRLRRLESPSAGQRSSVASRIPWQSVLMVLYMTSIFIMVRNIYRVIEYAMGDDGFLLTYEWPTYVFDGSLMVITMVIFFVWYPSVLQVDKMDTLELSQNRGGYSSDANTPIKHHQPLPSHDSSQAYRT